MPEKLNLIDELHLKQPNLIASCVVQTRLGANEQAVEFLLELVLVCYLAMHESGYEWPVITEAEQELQLDHIFLGVQFSEEFTDPATVEIARAQYIAQHPEQPLLAVVVSRCAQWLGDPSNSSAVRKSDKFVLMAAINLVDCIANAPAIRRRPA